MKGISWPAKDDELLFSSLRNVPPQELLNIRQKERASLEKYKYNAQKKLLEMRLAAGSNDYSKLVQIFQIEQKQELAEITRLFGHIKKNYLRKFAFHIGNITFSASGAMLLALASTRDPIALLGVGLGSSGAAIGFTKLIETWITYQADMNSIQEKDNYILWRVNP